MCWTLIIILQLISTTQNIEAGESEVHPWLLNNSLGYMRSALNKKYQPASFLEVLFFKYAGHFGLYH